MTRRNQRIRRLASAVVAFAFAATAFAFVATAQTVSIPPQAGPTPMVEHSRASLIDINTASPQQLKALPGMGDEYVRRIINGRPYTAKNQLVSRGILPQSAYARIAAEIIARRPRK